MLPDSFNPYVEWLGIDPEVNEPTYYDLFQISSSETDELAITQSADRAISAVRGCRPGEHSSQWAELLDTLRAIKTCLLDPERRAAYDQYLQQNQLTGAPSADLVTENDGNTPALNNDMFPPGMGGSPVQTQHQANDHRIPNPTSTNGTTQPLSSSVPDSNPSDLTAPAALPTANSVGQAGDLTGGVPILEAATPDPVNAAPLHYVPVNPVAIPCTVNPTQTGSNPNSIGQAIPVYANPAAIGVAAVAIPQTNVAVVPATPTTPPQPAALDPMAPIATMGSTPVSSPMLDPYAATSPIQADPMAPVVPDPMAPVASAIPDSNSNSLPATASDPFATQPATAQRLVAPDDTDSLKSGPDVEGKATPSSMANDRQQRAMQTPVLIALGLGVFCLFAAGVYFAMQTSQSPEVAENRNLDNTQNKPRASNPPNVDKVANKNLSESTGETRPKRPPRTPTVEGPKPDPEVTPTPMPKPMPIPPVVTPTPTPIPAPTPTPMPAPVVKPTRDEVVALSKALTTARIALYEKNIETAQEELKKAVPLAKLPEHKAKLERLQEITGHVDQFWNAVVDGTSKLAGGDVLNYKDIPVAIVEASPTKVIYRINGRNNTRSPKQLGEGLAILIANQVLVQDDPTTKIIKGALYAVKVNGDNPEYKADALRLWQEAALAGAEVDDLIQFLDDDYDLIKDFDGS